MTILKTLLGSYIPTFFEMHVATRDDDMTINQMMAMQPYCFMNIYIFFKI